jgi:hypothetical protein
MNEIIKNLKECTAFRAIKTNIKVLGFWKWFLNEFNTGWYATRSFKWSVFLKSCFNYAIGHPFLGFGVAAIATIVFKMQDPIKAVLVVVLLEQARQFFIQKKAAAWYPNDCLADIFTWLIGGAFFHALYFN